MDIKKLAVAPTKRLHLRDAADQLIYADTEKTMPVCVNLYGPGSKEYVRAKAAQSNRLMDKIRRKGKFDQTAEQNAAENAEFLTACTASWENLEYGHITEANALSMAVYSDESIGFIADQITKELNEWSNFTRPSTTN